MALAALLNARLSWGDLPLLDDASMAVEAGERIGLIGRNGTGKSSLLSVLAGLGRLDDGEIQRQDNLHVHYVEQEPHLPAAETVKESLVLRGKIRSMHDEREQWRAAARIEEYLARFELDPEANPALMSGGEKRRAALSLAFALEPQLLLLDEPTNHLDIAAILLLEEVIKAECRNQRSLVVVAHDRCFLDSVSTRIIELDRGILRSYPGNFAAYESRKKEELSAEALARQRFDKFWAQEEAWIRKGIEARRTRNEGRVRRLEALRRERAARRERMGSINLQIDAGMRSGKVVAEATNLCKNFEGRDIVKNLNFTLLRGDRLGIIGRNGAGKSTLIKLLLGEIAPDRGTVKLGTNLQIAYFDQLREQLDLTKTVSETIAPGSDWVEIAGQKKHVVAYLGDFLFPPRRAKVPVSSLSKGERSRLLLARLFALPANLLVLDEPTNDLDIDSIGLLEQTLSTYPGTIILVSHNRSFLDNVVTELLAPEGDGVWREYVGGYEDWLRQRPDLSAQTAAKAAAAKAEKPAAARDASKKIRLSYKEAKELENLPGLIEELEAKQSGLIAKMSSSGYHSLSIDEIKADRKEAQRLEEAVAQAYERWEILEAKRLEAQSARQLR